MPSQPRDRGQFARSADDESLLHAVGEIIREAGFDTDEYVSTRAFDAAKRRLSGFEHVPTARQISTRLDQRWPDILAVARGAPGAPRPADAILAWGRAEENPDLDERNVIFALGLVARELEQDTLTPDEYEQGVRALLHAARRDGRGHVLAPLLPTAAQIVRVAGDWDVALAMTGLRPRPGVQLTEAGQQRAARVWRDAHGTPADPPARRETVPAHDTGTEAPPGSEPLTSGASRGGQQRRHRVPLGLTDAVVIFWQSQGGWPRKPGVLNAWAELVGTSTQDTRRHDWGDVLREADERIKELNGGEWPGRIWIARKDLDPAAPIPDDLPPRLDRRISDRAAIDGVKQWLRDGRQPGDRITHAAYRRWRPGRHGAPSLSAINNPAGRFDRVLRIAQRELARERADP